MPTTSTEKTTTWTVPAAAAIFGLTRGTVENWIQDKIIPPATITSGEERMSSGGIRRLNIHGLFAVAVAAMLRRAKASYSTVEAVAEFLRKTDSAAMLSAFEEGRTILVCSGELLTAQLVRPSDFVWNRSGINDVMLLHIDLALCWSILMDRLGQEE